MTFGVEYDKKIKQYLIDNREYLKNFDVNEPSFILFTLSNSQATFWILADNLKVAWRGFCFKIYYLFKISSIMMIFFKINSTLWISRSNITRLIYTALFNTCFATPLLMKCPSFHDLKKHYFEQLDFILKEIK